MSLEVFPWGPGTGDFAANVVVRVGRSGLLVSAAVIDVNKTGCRDDRWLTTRFDEEVGCSPGGATIPALGSGEWCRRVTFARHHGVDFVRPLPACVLRSRSNRYES